MSNDGTAVIQHDPYLAPYASFFRARYSSLQLLKKEITLKEGSIERFTSSYNRMGFSVNEKGITFREYAPAALAISLIGEFNGWDRSHSNYNRTKKDFGMWELFLPRNDDGSLPIPHNSKVKLSMIIADGRKVDRIPVWIRRVVQEKDTANFDGIFWCPDQQYKWKYDCNRPIDFNFQDEKINELQSNGRSQNENEDISNVIKDQTFAEQKKISNFENEKENERRKALQLEFQRLRIYEAHIGMSSEEPIVSTYTKFKDEVLPHISKLGYNCIQLMGIMEHSYYASFGYQVTNLFAVSSRYGSPDELKELIDEAHRLNIIVLLDVVHSHVSKNVDDGINQFDGTTYCYFHEGERGYHPLWDSRL